MDPQLFDSKLRNHSIFKELKDSLHSGGENLCNLMELKDEVLFVWHPLDNCLLALNLKQLEENERSVSFQKLLPLTPPSFTVERLLAGACGTRLCVWGSRGAVLMELPSRWGRAGLFDGGKETVLCKSFALDERFLHSLGEVRRIHWHPSSLSHVLVLVSDNTIRLYNIALKQGPKLVKILNIGPKPASLLAGRRILDSLGDTAVDFSPVPNSDSLLVLRGDGNVYMIDCDLTSKSPHAPKLRGPLTMYPPADDNYGVESCSILVLVGMRTVPVIVIATCSAILYHCLLLPENNVDKRQIEEGEEASHALYVVEAVELSIVLSPDVQLQYSYPVHLYPCGENSDTYVCMHAAGVHSVSMPMIAHLKDFMLAQEDEIESVVSCVCNKASTARYLLCTLGPRSQVAPPAGLVATAPPHCAVLILCDDGNVAMRSIEPYGLEEQLYKELQVKNAALEQDEITDIIKERQKVTFSSIIQEILSRDVSQPLLNINKKEEPSPKESLEFLTQATLKLRVEYMSRQNRAGDAFAKKISSLKTLHKRQQECYIDLQKDMDEVQLDAAVLKEKCAIAENHQDDMKNRCSAVIRGLRASAQTSPAERELLQELKKFQLMSETYADQITRLKQRIELKNQQMKKWQEDYKKKDIALGKSHSDTISSILQQQTGQISTLIEDTKLLKDQLSIV